MYCSRICDMLILNDTNFKAMHTYINLSRVSLLTILFGCIITSCKKEKKEDVFPTPIANIISQSMIDSIRAAGATVHSGTSPAIVNGIYFMHPDSCIYDNSPANFRGTLFTDYKFRFSNQDNNLYTILVEQKAIPSGTLSTTPVSVYISGSGNRFSIFLLRTSVPSGISVQQFNVLSGTLTANGIQDFQNTLYLRSKGSDPGNTLPPAGTIRVFVNGAPGLAVNSATF